jgi:hypothetical protein
MLAAPTFALGQGALISKGESGIGISTQVTAAQQSTSYGIAAGYTYETRFDVGVAFGGTSVTRDASGYTIPTVRATFVSPSITFYPLRQDDSTSDVSIGLTAAALLTFPKGGASSENAYAAGFTLFEPIVRNESVLLQSSVSVTAVGIGTSGSGTQLVPGIGFFFGIRNALGKMIGLGVSGSYLTNNASGTIELSCIL